MNTGRIIALKCTLVVLSLAFLSVGTLAGLMHEWHRVIFVSLAGLDNSFDATLVLLLLGIACWILAGLLLNDDPA